ncbi:MAG: deoxyribonuclease V [Chromatiaceae bacterium]|jgi:deoxyribonuclease V|nr:deoxyribonuclease V [Chromatiaceae bacterium]
MNSIHPWDVTPAQARTIQEQLREQLVIRDDFTQIQNVAGLDVGFEHKGKITRAAVVVLRFPELEPLDCALAKRPTSFPYVPGLLSFREIPAVMDALGELRVKPDLLLCDGQGYAHPRRFGLACHLGLLTGLPSIGVAKSRLIGEHGNLGRKKGARAWLRHDGEVIGALLRTRAGVQPLYVSVGHRIGLETALEYVLACTSRYRLPETTRQAHRLASEMKGR